MITLDYVALAYDKALLGQTAEMLAGMLGYRTSKDYTLVNRLQTLNLINAANPNYTYWCTPLTNGWIFDAPAANANQFFFGECSYSVYIGTTPTSPTYDFQLAPYYSAVGVGPNGATLSVAAVDFLSFDSADFPVYKGLFVSQDAKSGFINYLRYDLNLPDGGNFYVTIRSLFNGIFFSCI